MRMCALSLGDFSVGSGPLVLCVVTQCHAAKTWQHMHVSVCTWLQPIVVAQHIAHNYADVSVCTLTLQAGLGCQCRLGTIA